MSESWSDTPDLIVPSRYCGPPGSGNGGWTSGALATLLGEHCPDNRAESWPSIEVTLRQPPPLDTPMPIQHRDGTLDALHDDSPVASARLAAAEPTPVEPVDLALLDGAPAALPAEVAHLFGRCFVCGPERAEHDGLRLFPLRLGPGHTAVTWTPDPSLAEDFHSYVDEAPRTSVAVTWAALDCIGGWAEDLWERPCVLGRMTARVDALPVIGEPHLLVGELRGREGRKTFTAATLYDADGREVATAEHTWIAIDPADFA